MKLVAERTYESFNKQHSNNLPLWSDLPETIKMTWIVATTLSLEYASAISLSKTTCSVDRHIFYKGHYCQCGTKHFLDPVISGTGGCK